MDISRDLLFSWWPLLVFAAEVILLTLQVRSEEKRLEADFGDVSVPGLSVTVRN